MEDQAIKVAEQLDKGTLILFLGGLFIISCFLAAIIFNQLKAILLRMGASIDLLIKGFERHSTILEFHQRDIEGLKTTKRGK